MRGGVIFMHRIIGIAVFIIMVCMSINDLTAGDLKDDADSLLIITPIEAKRDVLPDRYVFSANITVESRKEVDALNILGEIDEEIRNSGVSYKGGRYSVSQNCWWERNSRVCKGYKGIVNYRFEMSDPASQNKILGLLSGYKERSSLDIDINISSTRWIVSEDRQRGVIEELRFEVIRNSMDFAEQVSGMLKRPCLTREINFQHRPAPVYPPYRTMMEEKTARAPEPTKDEYSIGVNARAKIICK